jgi:hypothetical protein
LHVRHVFWPLRDQNHHLLLNCRTPPCLADHEW